MVQLDSTSSLARELAALVVESLGLDGVSADEIDLAAPLFGDGLGLDSLDLLELALVIHQRYGVMLKADDAQADVIFASLQSLADHVGANRVVRS